MFTSLFLLIKAADLLNEMPYSLQKNTEARAALKLRLKFTHVIEKIFRMKNIEVKSKTIPVRGRGRT
jgi:hypothetical protein